MTRPLLAHTIVGTGEQAVILLHGFLGSGRNVATLARRWSEVNPSLRIIVPDLTGHGGSPPLPPGADLFTLAEDVLALRGELGLSSTHWVGHSLGGRVAWKVLEVDPHAVERITAIDIAAGTYSVDDAVLEALLAAPEGTPDRDAMRAHFIDHGISAALTDWLLMNLRRDEDGHRWRIDRNALKALRDRSNAEDLWPVVENARVPMHLIRGGASPYVRPEDVLRFQHAAVSVDTIPDAGHFVHIDAADALLKLLQEERTAIA